MSDQTPVTPVSQAGHASHATPLKSKSLLMDVETGNCFQQQLKAAAHYLQIPNHHADGVNTEENLASRECKARPEVKKHFKLIANANNCCLHQ